jgi:hypothetical protein
VGTKGYTLIRLLTRAVGVTRQQSLKLTENSPN